MGGSGWQRWTAAAVTVAVAVAVAVAPVAPVPSGSGDGHVKEVCGSEGTGGGEEGGKGG